jgi:hypothetical protein
MPNLPLVSRTPVANHEINISLLTPKSELEGEKKFIFMLTLLPKGVQTKYLKLFLLKAP